MINHTTNPAERAVSIADREAEEVYEETRSYSKWLKVWLFVYRQSLLEFVSQAIIQES